MKTTTVNIRELKARLSHYLRLVRAGETVEITERGVPIGRIVPTVLPAEDGVGVMARSGLVAWNQRTLGRRAPVVRVQGMKTIAELLVKDRE